MLPLILVSSSPFRSELLARLQLPFSTFPPNIDETPAANEMPEQLVTRLTHEKAQAAKTQFPKHYIIASDQCAICENEIIGKPGNHETAVSQLTRFSGKKITFLTGLCLLNSKTGSEQVSVVPFQVYFRPLNKRKIEDYLRMEQPYSCAGSFKAEGLGILLFEKMEGDDFNSLIGLPLIRLISFFENEGVQLPLAQYSS